MGWDDGLWNVLCGVLGLVVDFVAMLCGGARGAWMAWMLCHYAPYSDDAIVEQITPIILSSLVPIITPSPIVQTIISRLDQLKTNSIHTLVRVSGVNTPSMKQAASPARPCLPVYSIPT